MWRFSVFSLFFFFCFVFVYALARAAALEAALYCVWACLVRWSKPCRHDETSCDPNRNAWRRISLVTCTIAAGAHSCKLPNFEKFSSVWLPSGLQKERCIWLPPACCTTYDFLCMFVPSKGCGSLFLEQRSVSVSVHLCVPVLPRHNSHHTKCTKVRKGLLAVTTPRWSLTFENFTGNH